MSAGIALPEESEVNKGIRDISEQFSEKILHDEKLKKEKIETAAKATEIEKEPLNPSWKQGEEVMTEENARRRKQPGEQAMN